MFNHENSQTNVSDTPHVNFLAVGSAAVAAFVFSSLYYSPIGIGNLWRAVDPASNAGMKPSILLALSELVRTVAVTYVLARILARLGSSDWKEALRLSLWMWFGFSFLMWIGAIMWENTPWQVAAIHSGDWLAKVIIIALIVSVWRKRSANNGNS